MPSSCARWPRRWPRTATASTCSACSNIRRSSEQPGPPMKVIPTELPGCVIIEPKVFGDARGFFYESWNRPRFVEHGLDMQFVQSNVSASERGVLRGLHYQWPNNVQGKLVSVLEGEVYD